MKRILLSVMVAGLSLIGFSSAYEYSEVGTYDCGNTTYESCEPSVSVPQDSIGVEILTKVDGNGVLSFSTPGVNGKFKQYQSFGVGTYMYDDNVGFLPKTMSLTYFVAGGKITYRFIYPDSPVPPIFEGGIEGLSGVVNNLSNTVVEFIPFIVYIGIGVFSAIIGFVAIKRLINWIRRKTYGSFS